MKRSLLKTRAVLKAAAAALLLVCSAAAAQGRNQITVEEIGGDLILIVAHVGGETQRIPVDVNHLRARGVIQIGSGAEGLPLEAAKGILSALGEFIGPRAVTSAEVEALLAAKAKEYAALLQDLATIKTGHPETEELVRLAQEALETGRLDEAEQYILEAKTFQEDLREMAGDVGRAVGLSATTAGLARVANLDFRYREAADHYRDAARWIAAHDPDRRFAYALERARALQLQGHEFQDAAATQQAIDHYHALALVPIARDRPLDHARALALSGLSGALAQAGREAEALETAQEAVGLMRPLAERGGEAFSRDLARALETLASRQLAAGSVADALETMQEADGLHRRLRLVGEEPKERLADRAASLRTKARILSALERRTDALAAAREADGLFLSLIANPAEAFASDRAEALGLLTQILPGVGRQDEAFALSEEAVVFLTPYFMKRPARYARWMDPAERLYLQACEEVGEEPDLALLAPVRLARQSIQSD